MRRSTGLVLLNLACLLLCPRRGLSWNIFSSSSASSSATANERAPMMELNPRGAKMLENARTKLAGPKNCWQDAYRRLFASCGDIMADKEQQSRLVWHLSSCFQEDSDFELSDAQYVHALAIEHLVPSLSDLRTALCSTDMSEACFWKIYFVLLHSKLNKQDAELLSTPQILEAREELLRSLQAKNKRESEVPVESSNVNVSSAPAEQKVIQPSSIQNKAGTSEVTSFEEHTSDITSDVEAEKFPIAITEVEIIDKSVIEEELSVKNESNSLPIEPKLHVETDEDEVDEWPDDDTADVVGTAGNRASLGQEEDVSFSDLEDNDDDDNKRTGK